MIHFFFPEAFQSPQFISQFLRFVSIHFTDDFAIQYDREGVVIVGVARGEGGPYGRHTEAH